MIEYHRYIMYFLVTGIFGFLSSALSSWFLSSPVLLRYRCFIINGRLQNCYRAKLFQITEQFIGFRASDVIGIGINGCNILVDVCFKKDDSNLCHFQSAVRNQCGRRGDIDNPYEISIGNEILSRIYVYPNLARIFGTDYIHVDNDDDTNNSPLCDVDGDSLSIYSGELANIN